MIKPILIFIIFFSCITNIYCSEKDVSIYKELCSFLVFENKIQPKDTIGIDPSSLVLIFDILNDDEINWQDSLGVYVFNILEIHDDIDYVLIKIKDSYAVFKENDPLSILIYLFAIKEKWPQILTSERCNEYIEKIIEINKHPIIGIPKGQLLFYTPLK